MLCTIMLGLSLAAAPAPAGEQVPLSIEIILDASGSMYDTMGGKTRIAIAKQVLTELATYLVGQEKTEIGLRVYGNTSKSCKDSTLLVPIGKTAPAKLAEVLQGIQPLGKTPIGFSLSEARKDLAGRTGERVVILLTDGDLESCGDDYCAAGAALASDTKVHVVGFALKAAELDKMKCIAEPSGGVVVNAAGAAQLKEMLTKIAAASLKHNLVVGGRDSGGAETAVKVRVLSGKTVVAEAAGPTVSFSLPPGSYVVETTREGSAEAPIRSNVEVQTKEVVERQVVFRDARLRVSVMDQTGKPLAAELELLVGGKVVDTAKGAENTFSVAPGTYDLKAVYMKTGELQWRRGLRIAAEDDHAERLVFEVPEPERPAEPPPVAAPLPTTDGPLRSDGGFRVHVGGHLRATYTTIAANRFLGVPSGASDAESRDPLVGKNDGFGVAAARLALRGDQLRELSWRLGMDFAAAGPDGAGARLESAYASYRVHDKALITAGRFRPPFDVESLTPAGELLFTHRALESRGILRHEGHSAGSPGFSPGYETGLLISSSHMTLVDRFALGVALALTNGNGGAALNDNDLPAGYMRVEARWRDRALGVDPADTESEGPVTYGVPRGSAVLGVSCQLNQRALGEPPDAPQERVLGLALDFATRMPAGALDADVRMQIVYFDLARTDADADVSSSSLGGHVQLAIGHAQVPVSLAYRFAHYDPRLVSRPRRALRSDGDRLLHHTVGLRAASASLPLVGYLDYTRSLEQRGRALANDQLNAGVQVSF